MKKRKIIGFILIALFNPVTLFLFSSTIRYILALQGTELSFFADIFSYAMWLLYLAMFFLIPLWIFLTIDRDVKWEKAQDWARVYAGFWKRFAANMLDGLSFYLVIPIFVSLYFYFKRGQTLGKMIMWIKVTDISINQKPSVGVLFARPFAKILSSLPLYIWFLVIGLNKRKQWWHDHLCHTSVIEIRSYHSFWTWFANLPIVVTILAIIATSAMSAYQWYIDRAQDVSRQNNLRTMSSVIEIYKLNNGIVPTDKEELINILNKNSFTIPDPIDDRCYFYASSINWQEYLLLNSWWNLWVDWKYPLYLEGNLMELRDYFSGWLNQWEYISCSASLDWASNLNTQ